MTTESHELVLFATNTESLYKQAMMIVKSLKGKMSKGVYDADKALIMWKRHSDIAAKAYADGFGGKWNQMFSVADRNEAAKEFAEYYEESLNETE